jgi:hypothetical protein
VTTMGANPYAPPTAQTGPAPDGGAAPDLDLLLAQTQLTPGVKAAIWLVATQGGVLLFSALQLWDVTRLEGAFRFVPYGMAVCGIACLLLAARLYRLRAWAAITALVVNALSALVMGPWFLVAGASGFVSLLTPLAVLLGIVAAVFAGLAIGPCRRAVRARARLAASGLAVDF